jgi:lipoprotein LprG
LVAERKLIMNSLTPHSHPTVSRAVVIAAGATLFAGLVTACGSDSGTSTDETSAQTTTTSAAAGATTSAAESAPTPDAAQMLAESAKTTQTLRSIHLNLVATDLPNLPVERVDADVTSIEQGNGQAIGSADFRLAPDRPAVPTDFLVTEKTFYTMGPDGAWVSEGPSEKIYDPAVILDREKGLANLIGSVQDPTAEGDETIDGVETVKISGTVDAAVVDPIVPSMGEGGGQLPITLWIADVPPPDGTPASTIPSEAPSPGTGPNLVRVVIDKGDGSVDATLSKWAVPVTIPSPTG